MRVDNVWLVGCGGIGSLLVEPLARLLAFHPDGTSARITLYDPDTYEAGNAGRQLFAVEHEGQNKARATADRLTHALGILPEARPCALGRQETAHELTRGGHTLVVLAVDNTASHRAVLDAVDDALATHPGLDVTVLRPGSGAGERWGLVTVSAVAWRSGRRVGSDPRVCHPEVATPTDRIPGAGCVALAPSEPQRIASNALASAMTLAYTSAILDNRPWPDEWHGELGDGHEDTDTAWRSGPAGETVGP